MVQRSAGDTDGALGLADNAAALLEPRLEDGPDELRAMYGALQLHAATTADYAGASPMVGFGAGAYLIALADRGTPVTPTCGSFAAEPSP